ncbi:MAG TPA: hypothetical protein VFB33_01860 [Candidatus Binataceae bacterium]|jgi:hypothetical protein|nr:hypothetical protein [Candidatus Binataceae bacterium]
MARFKDMVRVARVATRVFARRALLAASAVFKPATEESPAAEDRMPAVFQPEVLLPSQYYEAMRRKHLMEGEKLLMFAVLEDAVNTFMKYVNAQRRRGQRLFREAEEWINQHDPKWPFSFENICQFLDIDPEYLRAGLRRWKEAKLKEIEQSRRAAHTPEGGVAAHT